MAKEIFWIRRGLPMRGDQPIQPRPKTDEEMREEEAWKNTPLLGKIAVWVIIGVIGLLPEIIGYYFFW